MRFSSFNLFKLGPFRHLQVQLPKKTVAHEAEVHIFTGTNGTGKSTILRCLAGFIQPTHQPLLKRIWPLEFGDFSGQQNTFTPFFFEHDWLGRQDLYHPKDQPSQLYSSMNYGGANADRLASFVNPYHQDYTSLLKTGPVKYAAFGYAGGRTFTSTGLTGISEIAAGPLQNALSFDQTVNPQTIVQWIATTKTKEAMAYRKNQHERVEKHQRSIERIESAISEIIESPISFEFEDEPALQVKVKVKGSIIEFDVLPDGLKSILSWLSDLLMRLDRIPWEIPMVDVLSQPFSLFLDEVDVHLHPRWQRKILRVAQKLFPNAQIFVATHSPFVVSSIEGGWIHRFRLQEDGTSVVIPATPSRAGHSYDAIVEDIFGIDGRFDEETEKQLSMLRSVRQTALVGDAAALNEFQLLSNTLRAKSPELAELVELETRQLNRILGQKK